VSDLPAFIVYLFVSGLIRPGLFSLLFAVPAGQREYFVPPFRGYRGMMAAICYN
jgi:hypothetical protein